MEVALGVKMKLGIARGDFPRPTDPYQLAKCERCNNIFSWIINSVSKEVGASLIHAFDCIASWDDLNARFGGSNDSSLFSVQQEIAELMQGDMSIAKYYGRLMKLCAWTDPVQAGGGRCHPQVFRKMFWASKFAFKRESSGERGEARSSLKWQLREA
ncbi:unnamed protein product [Rhodiola kirilowii]